jgi:hypothetical protein
MPALSFKESVYENVTLDLFFALVAPYRVRHVW